MFDDKLNPDSINFYQSKFVNKLLDKSEMCIVKKLETVTEGGTDFNGFVTVQKLYGSEMINHVMLPWPIVGNSQFCGGLPLENTLCLVSTHTEREIPIVIAYFPFRLDELLNKRGSVTDNAGKSRPNFEQLIPGELLFQAAKKVVDSAKVTRQIPLGRVKIDTDGDVVISSKNQIVKMTIGNGKGLKNSITNKNIVMRVDCKKADESNGIIVDIDDDGNYIIKNAVGDYIIMQKDSIEIDSKLIKIGAGATQAMILGDLFKILFDNHVHPDILTGFSGKPVIPMPSSHLSTTGKVLA